MNSSNRRKVKMYAAVFGGSAVVALGALSTAVVQQPSGGQNVATGVSVGAVTSSTAAPAAPVEESVMSAVPDVKASQMYYPGQSPNHTPV